MHRVEGVGKLVLVKNIDCVVNFGVYAAEPDNWAVMKLMVLVVVREGGVKA